MDLLFLVMTGLAIAAVLFAVFAFGKYFIRLRREQQVSRVRLAASEQNLTKTFDAIQDAILILNELGTIEYANEAAESLFGYSRRLLSGASVQLVIPGIKNSDWFTGESGGLNPEEGNRHVELQAMDEKAKLLQIDINIAPITMHDATRYLLTIKDISEIKSLEASLIVRDRAFASIPDAIVITDPHQPDNPIIYCNRAFEVHTGYQRDEIIGRNCRFLQGDDTRQNGVVELRAAIEGCRECKVVLRNYRRDGSMFWNELCVSPVYNKDGALTHFLGIQNDITHHRLQEEELVSRNMRLMANQRTLLALAQSKTNSLEEALDRIVHTTSVHLGIRRVGVWLVEGEEARCRAFHQDGGSRRETFVLPVAESGLLEAFEKDGTLVAKTVDNIGQSPEFDREYVRQTGITSLIYAPVRLDGKLIGFFALEHLGAPRDWSQEEQEFAKSAADLCALAIASEESRTAVTALRESEARLLEAQRMARLGNFEWNRESGVTTWCPMLCEMLGQDAQFFVPTEGKILSMLHPDDRQNYVNAFNAAISTEQPLSFEYRIRHANGTWLELDSRGCAFADRTGKIVGIRGTAQDITERVGYIREKERLERQLRQAQKLETIGTLAGGIAHDFNNLLTPILGYTDIVLRQMSTDDKMRQHLEQVMTGAKRAKDLIYQIMAFSKHTDIQFKPVQLAEVINNTLKLLRPSIPATIEIKQDIQADCPPIMADPAQMRQVLMNLCTNACQSMADQRGVLTVRLQELNITPALSDMLPTFTQNEYVCLSVQDTGVGIDSRIKERVFEPFFTTKPVDEGTGLGLSVLHGIVNRHHGEIVVDSPSEGGTIFSIYFPVVRNEVISRELFPTEIVSGTEKILVVDDEGPIAELAAMLLEDLGYDVTFFVNPESALAHFKQDPDRFDLLLTDLTMPGLNGIELATECRRLNDHLLVLLMTGYEEEAVTQASLQTSPVHRVVRKPLIGARLSGAVREVLDAEYFQSGTDQRT